MNINNHSSLKKLLLRKNFLLNGLKKNDHEIFNKARFIREVQNQLKILYRKDELIKCPIHLAIGQELPAVILNSRLKKEDDVYCHHRSHAHFLSKTNQLNKLFCELLGKSQGANKGFAGSQDISYAKKKFYAGAIVTGGVGIAVGSAFASKLQNKNNISVAVFGEGASHQGLFWESINFSVIKNIPIIFFCENNKYATYSDYKENFKSESLSSIASSFGITTLITNTFDYNDLKSKILKSIAIARKGKPIFIEILTYRYSPHVGPDDDTKAGYRNSSEINFWKSHDLLDLYINKYLKINYNNKFNEKIIKNYNIAKKLKFKKVKNWHTLNFSDEYLPLFKKIKISKKLKLNNRYQKLFTPNPY